MSRMQEQSLKKILLKLSYLLGAEHLAVADAWVNLGLCLQDLGKLEEAEYAFKKALAIRRKCLDSGDETITHLYYYLGKIYFENGDFYAAKREYERCIEIYENECRPEDAFLATVLDSLAQLNHDRDKYKQAEALLKRSLFIRLCVLDPFEPAIAESMNHLGWLYSQNGRFKKAEDLLLSALDIWLSTLGPVHSNTAMCLENYAFVLSKTGRDKEALELLDKVESIRCLRK